MSRGHESADKGRESAEQAPEDAELDAVQLIVALVPYVGCAEHPECRVASEEMLGRLAEEQDEAWSRAVNLALFHLHLEVLSHQSWPGGWQPADLARVATRDLGPVACAAMTDLMAAELRGYAPATIDEVWHDQLADLGARLWWSEDGAYVPELAKANELDRLQVIDLLMRLLQLVARLPPLDVLTALPGQARAAASRRTVGRQRTAEAGGGHDEKLLSRVRALLAKAESSTYEAEAETFTAAAQAMMARHSIDEALLWGRREGHDEERPSGIRLAVDNPYAESKAMLLQQIAEANRCRAVWSRHQGFSTVLGYRPDTAWVEILYTSLLVQATRAMTNAGPRTDAYGTSRTRAFRSSFLSSFAVRIGERLRETTEQAEAEAQAEAGAALEAGAGSARDLLPVLADRHDAVEETLTRIFPMGTSTNRRARRSLDREGWAFGRRAADLADLASAQTLGPGSG
jgi:hypothetical protein